MLTTMHPLFESAARGSYLLPLVQISDLSAAHALMDEAVARHSPLLLACRATWIDSLPQLEARRFCDDLRDRALALPTPLGLLYDGLARPGQIERALGLGFSAAIVDPSEAALLAQAIETGLPAIAVLTTPPGDSRGYLLRAGESLDPALLRAVRQAGPAALDLSAALNAALRESLRGLLNAPDFEPAQWLPARDAALRTTFGPLLDAVGSAGQAPPRALPDVPTLAQQLFSEGYSCAESIFMAFSISQGYPCATAQRAASSFVGGMANQGLTCGTLIGGLMVIGAQASHSDPARKGPRRAARALATELIQWYQSQQGSTLCRDLLKLDLSDPAQASQFSQERHFQGVCMPLMAETCAWLVTSLQQEQDTRPATARKAAPWP